MAWLAWLHSLLAELRITAVDGTVWLAIGQGLLVAAVCLAFGIWVARLVGLLDSEAPAGETVGVGLGAGVLVLTVMIAPLMISIFSDGLRSVKPGWVEGSLALGVNRWRTTWKIVVRTARPAIVAGTVLAVARAIGEAVMLAMISGSVGFAPNPADGVIFIYEPSRPLAPTIVKNIDSLGSPPANATLFAIAAVLLLSAAFFSLAGWVARRSMRKYGATA